MNMKSIEFTNEEIYRLKSMLNAYIMYMLESGANEDYYEVRACRSLIEKLKKEG